MKEYFDKINLTKVVSYLVFMFLTLMAQNMVFGHLRFFGVCPMLLPAVAVAAGMFEGATWGPLFSMLLGYFADMSFIEHRLFFLLLLPALSLMSAFMSQFFINRRFFAFMGITSVALLITGLLQMLQTLAGDSWSRDMIEVVILQTILSLPPAALAYPLPARWSRK